MAMFWFILFVIFFILWLNRKPKDQDITVNTQSSYDQGYWDGWRAFGRRVQSDIKNDTVSHKKLQSYIGAGATGILPPDPDAEPTTPPVARSQDAPATAMSAAEIYVATPETPIETSAEEKQRLALKNLNTMLYVASFLLVAAAAAFIASSTPESVRLVLLWVVVGLFYGGGLLLHARSERLRPAALSFVGTGLAILPFAGLALTTLAHVPGQVAWFITSLIGIVAYGAATIIVKRAVIAYLTMAFVLSLASSTVSMLQLPLVWGFVMIMVVALVAHFIATLWPKILPAVFKAPVEQTGQYVTPIALVASLTVASQLTLAEYTLIFSVAALQYIVFWTQQRTYANETIARGLTILALSLLGFTVGEDNAMFVTIWQTVLVTINAVYSLVRVRPGNPENRGQETAWLVVAIIGLVFTLAGWSQAGIAEIGLTIIVELTLLIAAIAAFRLRQVGWGYVCLAASVMLPFSIGGWITGAPWYEDTYPWVFLIASIAALWKSYQYTTTHRSSAVKQFASITFWTYTIVATVMAFISYGSPLSLWMILFASLAAATTLAFSYIRQALPSEGVAIGFVALVITTIVWNTSDVHIWHSLIIVGVLYLVLLIGGLIHTKRNEAARTAWVLGAGQLVATFFALGIASAETRLSATLLLVAVAIGAAARYVVVKRESFINTLYAGSTIVYLLLAWSGSLYLNQGWQVLVLAVAAAIYWILSYRSTQAFVAVVANIAALGAIITLFSWIDAPAEWCLLLTGWVSAAVYAIWYGVTLSMNDTTRTWIHVISAWIILATTALACLGAEKAVALAACATLLVLAASIWAHGYTLRRTVYFDVAAFIGSFAVQTAITIQWPETPMTVYGHLTAATILGVALWRRHHGQTRTAHYFLAAGSLTLGAAISAFTEESIYQLIFLIEHIAILVIGGLRQWQKVVWWGVASTVAAILYFLRDYFFLWLAFLGIVLIAIVIWRLSRIDHTKQP